jgi:hypothetical protein
MCRMAKRDVASPKTNETDLRDGVAARRVDAGLSLIRDVEEVI